MYIRKYKNFNMCNITKHALEYITTRNLFMLGLK